MMAKLIFILFTTLLPLLTVEADEPVSSLNGAFRQTKNKYGSMTDWRNRDSVTVIKVFRDGYWFGAFYDDKRRGRSDERNTGPALFNGACGGTYALKNGKYVETVDFYSWDSTAVGNRYTFDYKISPKQYEQYGMMNSEQYKNYPINEISERITAKEPLKNNGLEGVWFMKEGQWGTTRLGEGAYKGVRVVKLFSYPMVVYAYYNPATKQFNGAGGATYQFDGTTLTETNAFFSWDNTTKGKTDKFRIATQNNQFVQTGETMNLREVWEKAPVPAN